MHKLVEQGVDSGGCAVSDGGKATKGLCIGWDLTSTPWGRLAAEPTEHKFRPVPSHLDGTLDTYDALGYAKPR